MSRKRIAVLVMKHTPEREYIYPTMKELVKHHDDEIGITINALWNALSKNEGKYENNQCIIYYRKTREVKVWE